MARASRYNSTFARALKRADAIAMNEHDPHSSPIKTPKQLVIVVVLAFVVPIAVILLITQLVTGVPHDTGGDAAVRARIAPVGTVEIAGTRQPGRRARAGGRRPRRRPPPGRSTARRSTTARASRATAPASPARRSSATRPAWAPRVAQGAAVLYDHAIKGYQGKAGVMPPKGGAMQLTDAQVKAAVDAMVAAAK